MSYRRGDKLHADLTHGLSEVNFYIANSKDAEHDAWTLALEQLKHCLTLIHQARLAHIEHGAAVPIGFEPAPKINDIVLVGYDLDSISGTPEQEEDRRANRGQLGMVINANVFKQDANQLFTPLSKKPGRYYGVKMFTQSQSKTTVYYSDKELTVVY